MNKCFFCQHKINPSFKDIENLEKFLTARMKISQKEKNNLCAHHQRFLAKQVRYARLLALLPYTSYQGQ